jgi:hypothetical protein
MSPLPAHEPQIPRKRVRNKKAVQMNGFFAFADSAPITNGES